MLFRSLERIGDHLTNIAFSIKSPSGSQREAMEKIADEQKRRSHERKAGGNSILAKAKVSDDAAAVDTTEDKGERQ